MHSLLQRDVLWLLDLIFHVGYSKTNNNIYWLVVEPTPLKNDGVRQLG